MPIFLITENVLDMMHISYVHSFGNQMSPIPYDIIYDESNDYAGKTTFYYNAGPTSMSSLIGNVYPSTPLVTIPVVLSVVILSSPKIPSLF